MNNPEAFPFLFVLAKGALAGAAFALVALRSRRHHAPVLGGALAIAALVYVGFAAHARASAPWLGLELVGVALYATFAMAGVRRSPWWMVAGWALHPVWDLAVHRFGPADWLAPDRYEIACLGFDLVVAALLAARLLRARPSRLSEVRS